MSRLFIPVGPSAGGELKGALYLESDSLQVLVDVRVTIPLLPR